MFGLKKKRREESREKFLRAIDERGSHIVHLSHNDLDAAGSDAVHRLRYGDIFTIWSSVGRFPGNLATVAGREGRGDTISISDLGYNSQIPGMLRTAKRNGWKIEWRDHHRWSDKEKEEIAALADYLRIDTSICATGVVAGDLMPGDKTSAEIARVVCDYDLWKHEDPRSSVLDCLLSGKFSNKEIEKIYRGISKEKEEDIKKSLQKSKIYEGRYRIAFAPMYGYPSETAHAIRDIKKTDIEVIVSDNGKFSIRSAVPISHLIAREFGGGGHPPAAGGKFDYLVEVAEKIDPSDKKI